MAIPAPRATQGDLTVSFICGSKLVRLQEGGRLHASDGAGAVPAGQEAGSPMGTASRLRLFPLNAVLFPGAALNLHVFEPRYRQLIAECVESGEDFGVVLIREGNETGDTAVEPHEIGCIARIGEVTPLPFDRYYVATVGSQRFRIRRIVSREPFITVEAEILEERESEELAANGIRDRVFEEFIRYAQLLCDLSGQPSSVELPSDACEASFAVGDSLQVADSIKQKLLEMNSTKARLTAELAILRRLLPQMRALLQRRNGERKIRRERGQSEERRNDQERYFGKYFSPN